ncbi:MAG: ATP-dependent Clp protease ATP-binding subunit [Acidobacteriota bacterium]
MDIKISELKKIFSFLSFFFPTYKIKKGELDRNSSEEIVYFLVHIIDLLLKSENLREKKNLELPEGRGFFPGTVKGLIENISLSLQKFDSNIFKFTKTERQTFLFVIENINEYFKNVDNYSRKKDKESYFLDYRFWVENLFKMFNQKINGFVYNGSSLKNEKNVKTRNIEHIKKNDLVFSTPMNSFSLSPFIMESGKRKLFLTDIDSGDLIYSDLIKDEKIIVRDKNKKKELFIFFLHNLMLKEAKNFRDSYDGASIFVKNFNHIESALLLHKQELYERSYSVLKELSLGEMEIPLLLLVQIENMALTGDDVNLKIALNELIYHYPYYYQGYELLGKLYEKEENPELANSNYEKALNIIQSKEIANRVKKIKLVFNKNRERPENKFKSSSFFDISATVYDTEEKIVSRENEIRQVFEILISGSKKNPIIIGDSGVGKSALIRLAAKKILTGEGPESLKGKRLKEINFVSLITGTKYRGQFEEKVVKLLNEFKLLNSILVLEDIHLMISPGTARGTAMDLVNILKQFLRENSIQVIATTTYEEFKNVIERDSSLMGYFQRIILKELSPDSTAEILKNKARETMESENIAVPEKIIDLIIENSRKNIFGKKLPDSALMIYERCISKVKLKSYGKDEYNIRVSEEDLLEVLADLLNLPESDVSFSMKKRLISLKDNIQNEIIGQPGAIEKLTSGIIASKLGFDIKDNRPDGVFLFVGPTGVGKSETALVLAKYLYGSGENLIRIDMSEYMERFTYSRFVGAAPGYVGYNDSTQLTDKIRQNPYSIVLLDEIEKADYQLLNIFLQVFDAGRLTDARGNVIDFSHATIIMTSNIGTSLFSRSKMGYQPADESEDVTRNTLQKALKKYFSPEFMNRIDEIVVFNNLTKEDIKKIINIQLESTREKLRKDGRELNISNEVISYIIKKGYSKEYGARNISRVIKNVILEKLAHLSLNEDWEKKKIVNCLLSGEEVVLDLGSKAIKKGKSYNIQKYENIEKAEREKR